MEKKKGLIIVVVILAIIVIGLGSYIIYDKVFDTKTNNQNCNECNNEPENSENKNDNKNESFFKDRNRELNLLETSLIEIGTIESFKAQDREYMVTNLLKENNYFKVANEEEVTQQSVCAPYEAFKEYYEKLFGNNFNIDKDLEKIGERSSGRAKYKTNFNPYEVGSEYILDSNGDYYCTLLDYAFDIMPRFIITSETEKNGNLYLKGYLDDDFILKNIEVTYTIDNYTYTIKDLKIYK